MVVPALFKLEPKESLEELYDFEKELEELRRGYEDGRIVAVLGLRRMGKSSLLRSFLNSFSIPHVYIDARRVAVATGRATTRGFMEEVGRALAEFMRREAPLRDKLAEALRRVRGVSVGLSPVTVTLSWGRERADLISLMEAVDEVVGRAGRRLALAIDEAQELRGIGVDIPRLLAYIYDNLHNVVVFVSGSQVGLLYDVLKLDSPQSPLYGRAVFEVKMRRLRREEAVDFLKRGFQQAGIHVSQRELEEAVDSLDGIIGWLTYFGWSRVVGAKSLEEILDAAARQEAEEISRFLAKSRSEARYRAVLKAVAARPMRWSEIKRVLEAEEGAAVDDRNLTDLLHRLEKVGLLEKREGLYAIPDPVVRLAVERYISKAPA
ncbi:MAG: ATP-binding protein [Pyrobaculum sp.]